MNQSKTEVIPLRDYRFLSLLYNYLSFLFAGGTEAEIVDSNTEVIKYIIGDASDQSKEHHESISIYMNVFIQIVTDAKHYAEG
jgi:hypothetical protein